MIRTCPGCHGFHTRRSSNPAAEAAWRRFLLSPYRCTDCRTRFWKISRKAYVVGGSLLTMITVWLVVWYAISLLLNIDVSPMLASPRA